MQTEPAPLKPGLLPSEVAQGMHTFLTNIEIWLSVSVLVFGLIVICILYVLLKGRNATPDDILKTFSVILIIIGSLFCVTAGFSSSQIAPAIGLFGTIIGYIIGRRGTPITRRPPERDKEETT